MKIKQYWSQQKVYLYGMCALLPEKIDGRVFGADQLDDYFQHFSLFTDDAQVKTLQQYQDWGMFKVEILEAEKSDALNAVEILKPDNLIDNKHRYKFRITNINQELFKTKLIKYLKSFKNNELSTGIVAKPESCASLENRLYTFTNKARAKYGNKPIVNLFNVWPDDNDRSPILNPFWELIFSLQLISRDINILNIGHFPVSSKRNADNAKSDLVPYAEIEILKMEEEQRSYTARVIPDDRLVQIVVDHDQTYTIKRLRSGAGTYDFIHFLTDKDNRNIDIRLIDVQESLKTCKSRKNLTELVRDCGFDESLKDIFFSKMDSDRIHLRPEVQLKSEELDVLRKVAKAHRESIVS